MCVCESAVQRDGSRAAEIQQGYGCIAMGTLSSAAKACGWSFWRIESDISSCQCMPCCLALVWKVVLCDLVWLHAFMTACLNPSCSACCWQASYLFNGRSFYAGRHSHTRKGGHSRRQAERRMQSTPAQASQLPTSNADTGWLRLAAWQDSAAAAAAPDCFNRNATAAGA